MRMKPHWQYLGALAALSLAAGAYCYTRAIPDEAALAKRWTDAGHSLLVLASQADDLPLTPERVRDLKNSYHAILDFKSGLGSADRNLLAEAQREAADIGIGHGDLVAISMVSPEGLELRAGAFFRRALVHEPGSVEAEAGLRDTVQLLLAQARLCEGDSTCNGSIPLYQAVLKIDPGNLEARSGLTVSPERLIHDARVFLDHGAPRQAALILKKAVAIDPANAKAKQLLPQIALLVVAEAERDIQLGYLRGSEGASGKLKEALSLDPDDQEAKRLIREVADRIAAIGDQNLVREMIDEPGDALSFYNEALELDPGNRRADLGIHAEWLLWDVWSYLREGSVVEAQRAIEEAAARDPNLPGLNTLSQIVANPPASDPN